VALRRVSQSAAHFVFRAAIRTVLRGRRANPPRRHVAQLERAALPRPPRRVERDVALESRGVDAGEDGVLHVDDACEPGLRVRGAGEEARPLGNARQQACDVPLNRLCAMSSVSTFSLQSS
jgi:hypothetical protein